MEATKRSQGEELSSGTKPVLALQLIHPMGMSGYFHNLNQRSREKILISSGTNVELCDGYTIIVVKKIKKTKTLSKKARIEIDILD